MFSAASIRTSAITLDDLVALNAELVSLVRAGVPLERSLGTLRGELPRRLSRVTDELARRTTQGQTLLQAIRASETTFPPVYRALVEAGLSSGRLDLALESISSSATRLADLRRTVGAALVYPIVVLLLAYCLLVFFLVSLLPQMISVAEGSPTWFMALLDRIRGSVAVWGPLFPVVVIALVGLWWFGTRRALALQNSFAARLFGFVPLAGPLVRDVRLATFCELLALLVRHQVPLPVALELAAASSGDRRWLLGANRAARAIEQGATGDDPSLLAELPPFLRWIILAGVRRGGLAPLLADSADFYRRRAEARANWLHTFLPAILVLVVGGLATLTYAVAVFLPFSQLLQHLAVPTS